MLQCLPPVGHHMWSVEFFAPSVPQVVAAGSFLASYAPLVPPAAAAGPFLVFSVLPLPAITCDNLILGAFIIIKEGKY